MSTRRYADRDLAPHLARFERGVGLRHVLEREHRLNVRSELTPLDQYPERVELAAGSFEEHETDVQVIRVG